MTSGDPPAIRPSFGHSDEGIVYVYSSDFPTERRKSAKKTVKRSRKPSRAKRKRKRLQRPDYRNNGQYQFIVGYTGGLGGVECVHLSREEISKRLTEKAGHGKLVDDGLDLWWEVEQIPDRSSDESNR